MNNLPNPEGMRLQTHYLKNFFEHTHFVDNDK
jgi:hypothetical protein